MTLARLAAPFLGFEFFAAFAGWSLARRWLGVITPPERVAWSFGFGLLAQFAVLGAHLAFGIRARPASMLGGLAIVGLAALFGTAIRSETVSPPPEHRGLEAALLAIAGAGVILFALVAIAEPPWGLDYLAIWGLKGKAIATTSSVPAWLLHDPDLAYSHREYPLMLPFTFAAGAAFSEGWDSRPLALLYPMFQAGAVFAVFGWVARRSGRTAGAFAAAMTACFFRLYFPYHVGMAEIPLAFAALLAFSAADDLRGGLPGAGVRAAIASLLIGMLKTEGTLLMFVMAAAVSLRSGAATRRSRALAAAALAGPAAAAALVLRLSRGALSNRDFDFGLLSPARLGELAPRISETVSAAAELIVRPAIVEIGLIAAVFALTRRGPIDWVLPVAGIQSLAYAAACVVCVNGGPAWLVRWSLERILLPLAPIVLAAACARVVAMNVRRGALL